MQGCDVELVGLLLAAGAEVDAQADGLFFYERASTYFGGPPVGLAAKLGNTRLADESQQLRSREEQRAAELAQQRAAELA